MTVKDFAKKINLSERTIYRHCKAGTIKTIKHPFSKTLIIPCAEAERILRVVKGD